VSIGVQFQPKASRILLRNTKSHRGLSCKMPMECKWIKMLNTLRKWASRGFPLAPLRRSPITSGPYLKPTPNKSNKSISKNNSCTVETRSKHHQTPKKIWSNHLAITWVQHSWRRQEWPLVPAQTLAQEAKSRWILKCNQIFNYSKCIKIYKISSWNYRFKASRHPKVSWQLYTSKDMKIVVNPKIIIWCFYPCSIIIWEDKWKKKVSGHLNKKDLRTMAKSPKETSTMALA